LSAHKFQGPKGVGALLLRQGVALVPQTLGSQERGRRGGTENLAGIVGMAAALDLLGDVAMQAIRLATLRDVLETGLKQALPETHVWCQNLPRLPGTSYLRFGQLSVDVVLQRLDRLGVAASSGAACSSGGSEPSHVLTAMGVPAEEALAAVRFSLGATSTLADVNHLLQTLPPQLSPLLCEELQTAP
jgi:cysteine desulfurase